LIDEANGEPVHPVGTKTVSALSAKSRAALKEQALAPAATVPAPAATPTPTPPPNWQPPTLPAV
jgi:hypothetical protein